ncbi:MAG: chromosome segregation protein SMC [Lewinellaceae bacterium]|nr:chromosome segregation protein SMC [Saprospiraceae bacterium]MCB9311472.1 chromosome segregation protein SMC [Lewinellaceae bacterium]
MRLQKLEIKGFKSFANDTVIHFNESVTGIIGPNGSGKSNIVDAIRWVLGEQKTRELRLERMSSVIFNGTKKRKASGMAQVSLTFENTKNLLPTEYQNVTVSRILYRTGESEYRINNVTCRLKDITSLFMDTGIGSNSYAIIALSMVDDILNDHEQSRRRMLEQAAGVSKYKVRKAETLRKLGHTEGDLNRVDDLLYEIEHNLKSLEKQARKAQRYLDLKSDYRSLSIEWAVFQTHDLKTRYKQIESKLAREEDQLREIEVQIQKAEVRTEQEKLLNLDKEKTLSDRQKKLNEVGERIRTLENQVEILGQRTNFIEQNRSKLRERMRFNTDRGQQLEKDILYYQDHLQKSQLEKQAGEVALREAEQELGVTKQEHHSIKDDLDLYLQQLQELEKGIYELEKQRAINLNQIDNLKNEIDRNTQVLDQRSKESHSLRSAVEEVSQEEARLQASVQFLEQEEDQRLATIQRVDEQLQQANQELSALNRQLDALRNEYKLTKSMVENLEGFPESIKYLNQQGDWGKQYPLLSDVITSKESFRIAIEHFLDQYLNYYVVPDVETAQSAIKLLQQNQKGKANFFIVNELSKYNFLTEPVVGLTALIDLVECEAQYQPLVNYLFHKVYLASDDVIPEQSMDNSDVTILGANGAWTRRTFSLSGGSIGLFEGKKLGRKKNLENLDKQIRKLEKEEEKKIQIVQDLKEKVTQLKQANQPARIREEKAALNQVTQRLITLKTRLENAEQYHADVSIRNNQALDIIQGLTERNETMTADLSVRKQEEADFRARMEATDQSFRKAADALNARSSTYNERNIRFIQLQNKVTAFEQEIQFREQQILEARKSLEADQDAERQAATEQEQVGEEREKLQQQLFIAYEEKKEKEAILTGAEQDYFQARGHINELESALRQLNKNRQDAQLLVNELKDNFNAIRLELTSIGERIKVEFQASIQEIIQREPNPDLDPVLLEQQVSKLKNRLENYGEVNPMAVEAYREMKERYDTIDQQRQDILQAKTSLLQTIEEIELTATEQFMAAFEQVRENFINVFRSLFTDDDTADLILDEPDKPLDSNIQIIAKPKGKRPQSINQLSGGEKTLTATALLFALYLLKPAPFCIFDEVDAPLDDSNIEKFNRIIQKFSDHSQFIIVTHNKLTMASVDVLYGVYMREQGISAVTPVDFRTYEHQAVMEQVQ